MLKDLDRESKSNYTLIIKATEDCANPPRNITDITNQAIALALESQPTSKIINSKLNKYYDVFDNSKNIVFDMDNGTESMEHFVEMDEQETTSEPIELVTNSFLVADDNTLVKVVVMINDINDNRPEFISKIFTGGVSTSADFGSKFMEVKAFDRDTGTNAKITFFQIGDIHRTLTEGLDSIQKSPFLVEKNTGAVLLNFDPQKGMKGYFDFMVKANDTDGLQDIAHVFIYLLREDQRVKFVLRQQPGQVRERSESFRR